ncbi:SepM family pheromone-processing serine protease [Paenibacillus ginsengarvi]|uniref:endopeptidase La n=1 Tax=Paenibacillus ginsengarvi TaxID=400777 RepID=A0A3B0CXP5_9BACL|nr:SepM family pheromone-processing serine protease [Paenibacillus ginsengarvi]RKN86566.1 PDZ domain-containing protein [Paenibacillus ginsengarvi]
MIDSRYRERSKLKWSRGFLSSFLLTITLAYAFYFIPVPYYIYKPGTAEELKPMVKVENGDPEEKGAFMLTTVSMGRSSILSFVLAKLSPNTEIRKKEEVLRGSTEQEYSTRQEYVMLDSQSSSIQAAYKQANIPFRIDSQGVLVMQTIKEYPAYGILLPGDKILQVASKPVLKHEDIVNELKLHKAEEAVDVVVKRGKTEKTVSVTLKDLDAIDKEHGKNSAAGSAPASGGRIGFGISTAELLGITPERSDKKVTIDAGEIGGPSAGLLFSLEIYNQLTPGDLTKSYRIAGTGTIDPSGNVCSIGGIRQKIVAADREKADIFFAPVDRKMGECNLAADVPNASDAADQAKKIDSKMKVVPVATLEEAVRYLESLKPKA